MELEKDNVIGMVFVDANTEFSYKLGPKGLLDALSDLQERLEFYQVINLESRHHLTPEEWASISDPEAIFTEEEGKKHEKAVEEECMLYEQSCDEIGEKKQYEIEDGILGEGTVSAVTGNNEGNDVKFLYEEALKEGHWSEQSLAIVKQMLGMSNVELELQQDQLKLSRTRRLVHAPRSGHDVQLTDPEIIVEEVKWILETLAEEKST